MDPDETYEQLLEEIKDQEWEDASHSAQDLADWLNRGGLIPQKIRPRVVGIKQAGAILQSLSTVLSWVKEDAE